MKYIRERVNAEKYLKKEPPQTSRHASLKWNYFKHRQKILNIMLSEQCFLCCYSELRADQYQLGYHIEHLENKSQSPQRTFDSSNIAASALRSDEIGSFKAAQPVKHPKMIFGGHAPKKQKAVDMQRFVSPRQADCARYFWYLPDGSVVPAEGLNQKDKDCALYTIDVLNLDSPFLRTERRKWRHELNEFYEKYKNDESALQRLASNELLPQNGKLSSFFSLTRQFYKRIAEDILQKGSD
ncbi:MAG: retron system putative HNH endonuclease [Pseudomonas sp.]|jgi:uncharacterized protein (TIGR02646 family)|uniref:retron system putative HNH endonuclease n=1 Tax=Pseudomonas sp. TaxID=306 RepID=UPI003C7E44A9